MIEALVDLQFADEKVTKAYNCSTCPAPVKAQRRCEEPGFDNFKSPRKLAGDDKSAPQSFCHAKASWYPDVIKVFMDCRVALESGILPRGGGLEDQDDIFYSCFWTFVERWRFRERVREVELRVELQKQGLLALSRMLGGKK